MVSVAAFFARVRELANEQFSSLPFVCLSSMCGTLLRIGLRYAFVSSVQQTTLVPIDIYANMFGCFALGFLAKFQRYFSHPFNHLYTGLTVGFCACSTTFSEWQQNAVVNLVKQHLLEFVWQEVSGYCIPMICLAAGVHSGELFHEALFQSCTGAQQQLALTVLLGKPPVPSILVSAGDTDCFHDEEHKDYEATRLDRRQEWNEELVSSNDESDNKNNNEVLKPKDGAPSEQKLAAIATMAKVPWRQIVFIVLLVVVYLVWFGAMIACILVAIFVPGTGRFITISLLFSNVGVWIRFQLAQFNKTERVKSLGVPIFTFIANLLGCTIASLCGAFSQRYDLNNSVPQLGLVLSAVDTGFCGSLTALSIFFVELYQEIKEDKDRYKYGLLTFGMSLSVQVLINSLILFL